MMLVRLTYFSCNRLERARGQSAGISEILARSVANNRRDGVTGAFIYDHQWFAQEIEGVEDAISATFERVLHDRRHADVTLVTMQPVPERRYAGLQMAAIARRTDNDDLFQHYCDGDFEPPAMRPDRIADLIEAVVDRRLRGAQSWTSRREAKTA
ncbi:MAG: BLUF domain-containing protein [Xanthobacteraceae bacterium]